MINHLIDIMICFLNTLGIGIPCAFFASPVLITRNYRYLRRPKHWPPVACACPLLLLSSVQPHQLTSATHSCKSPLLSKLRALTYHSRLTSHVPHASDLHAPYAASSTIHHSPFTTHLSVAHHACLPACAPLQLDLPTTLHTLYTL